MEQQVLQDPLDQLDMDLLQQAQSALLEVVDLKELLD